MFPSKGPRKKRIRRRTKDDGVLLSGVLTYLLTSRDESMGSIWTEG